MPDNSTTVGPFPASHKSEDEIAVEMTGEHDSEPRLAFSSHGDASSWRKCSACGVEAEDDYDGDNGKCYTSPGNGLRYCSQWLEDFRGCSCAVHPACSKTVGDKAGLCPHCAWIENEKLHAAMEAETLIERTAVYAASDVKRLREMLQSKDVPDAQREVAGNLLTEIAQNATLAIGENGAALIRSSMRPLVAA